MIRPVRKYDVCAVVDQRQRVQLADAHVVTFEKDDEGVKVTYEDASPFDDAATYDGGVLYTPPGHGKVPVMDQTHRNEVPSADECSPRPGASAEVLCHDPSRDTPEMAKHTMHCLREIAYAHAHPAVDRPPRRAGLASNSRQLPVRNADLVVTRTVNLTSRGMN